MFYSNLYPLNRNYMAYLSLEECHLIPKFCLFNLHQMYGGFK